MTVLPEIKLSLIDSFLHSPPFLRLSLPSPPNPYSPTHSLYTPQSSYPLVFHHIEGQPFYLFFSSVKFLFLHPKIVKMYFYFCLCFPPVLFFPNLLFLFISTFFWPYFSNLIDGETNFALCILPILHN